MTKSFVYINSPARSGSTFLQFLLSSHSEIIGLGELHRVVNEINNGTVDWEAIECTCGQSAAECEFWSELVASDIDTKLSAVDVVKRFNYLYPNSVLVDSSKNGDDMGTYMEDPSIDMKVILLVRDYRGWVKSAIKYRYKLNENTFINTNLMLYSYRWFYSTLKRMRTLKKMDANVLYVYYENLVFDLDSQYERIQKHIGVETLEKPGKMDLSTSHELFGNRALKKKGKDNFSIKYDASWMQEIRFSLYSIFLIPVGMLANILAKKSR